MFVNTEHNHQTLVKITAAHEAPPDVKISGRLRDCLKLLLNGDEKTLAGSGIELQGSLQRLMSLQEIFKNLELDWEQWIAEVTGDQVAKLINNTHKTIVDSIKNISGVASRRVQPTLTEEWKLVVGEQELEQYSLDIDELRRRSSILEQKVNKLKDNY
jgi:ubiquinone biosynthesis protein UbiJ